MHEKTGNSIFVVDSDDTGVSSVGSSESVVDEDVSEFSEFFSEGFNGFWLAFDLLSILILDGSFLFGMVSHVFAQEDASVRVVDCGFH